MLVLSETIGNFLLFAALLLLLRPSSGVACFIAGCLLALAGQVKETYAFAALLLLAHAAMRWRQDRSVAIASLGGFAAGLSGLIAILAWTDTLASYLDVIAVKAEIFRPRGVGSLLSRSWTITRDLLFKFYPLAILVVLAALASSRLSPGAAEKDPARRDARLLAAVMLVSVWIGFVAQGKSLSGHYLLTLWFPYVVAFAALVDQVAAAGAGAQQAWGSKRGRQVAAVAMTVALLGLMPGPGLLGKALERLRDHGEAYGWVPRLTEDPQALTIYREAAAALQGSGCLQEAYGWAAGSAYLYAGARPCSRFFLSNLIVTSWQEVEFRERLVQTPPSVVTYDPRGADLDTAKFERRVFPWARVLAACYRPEGSPTLYVANEPPEAMSQCLETALAQQWRE